MQALSDVFWWMGGIIFRNLLGFRHWGINRYGGTRITAGYELLDVVLSIPIPVWLYNVLDY